MALHRWALPGLLFSLAVGSVGRGDEPALKQVFALQEAMKTAIRRAEPSVACVLVSRSDLYRKLYNDAPPEDNPGKLGGYTPPTARPRLDSLAPDSHERRRLDLTDPENVPESSGSGVVIDPQGMILTNYHVVLDATKIYVRFANGKGSYADIHAADPRSDLAVLRILDEKMLPLPALAIGRGEDVEKGDLILTLANPWTAGFRDSSPGASWGIVSNLRRRALGSPREEDRTKTLHQYGTLIQTDVRLNLNCSGGALLNLRGEMVGLTTTLAAISGGESPAGFAVPLDEGMRRVIGQLREGREVEYGFLGVQPYAEPVRGGGVRIEQVREGTPAALARLQRGDVILRINGIPVNNHEELFLIVGTMLAGSEVQVEVDSQPRVRRMTLAKFYVPSEKIIAANRPPLVRGLRVDYGSIVVQRQIVRSNRIPPGVVIREVHPGSPADRARLQIDKMITHINATAVSSPTEFYAAMERARGPVQLTVYTPDANTTTVTLDPR